MNNIVTDCVRCKGRGTIPCPGCSSSFGVPGLRLNLYGEESLCRTCNGGKELNCPACLGKAKVMLPDTVEALGYLDKPKVPSVTNRNSSFTTARLVLAIHYLLDGFQVDLSNKSAEVRFIKFLIDRDETDIKKKLTEIRERGSRLDKRSKKTPSRSPKVRKEDLEFIKPFFAELKLTEIENAIADEIEDINEGS